MNIAIETFGFCSAISIKADVDSKHESELRPSQRQEDSF